MLAWIGIVRRDDPSAQSAVQEALTLSREAGDSRGILVGLGNLGHVALRQGRLHEALHLLVEAVPLAYEHFDLE